MPSAAGHNVSITRPRQNQAAACTAYIYPKDNDGRMLQVLQAARARFAVILLCVLLRVMNALFHHRPKSGTIRRPKS